MPDLRKQFAEIMIEFARKDDSIVILTGDLGFNVLEPFQKEFPYRFINCGCMEQSMIGIACGMALEGYKPYVYSNSLFLLSRANEFVRDDVCYNNLNIKLIGTGASGFLGFSHNMVKDEDKNLLKSFPNIKSYYPKDEKELVKSLKVCYNSNNPVYIKI